MPKSAYEQLFEMGIIDQDTLFSALMSVDSLVSEFKLKFAKSGSKGVDRLNGVQFAAQANHLLTSASEKCLTGAFGFSPYLESLKSKGRGKNPRLISMPTIRDRVVLRQLNKFLAALWPNRVPKNIASTYVRQIAAGIEHSPRGTWVCKTDIQSFYDVLRHDRLIVFLKSKVHCEPALALVQRAISTPTVEKNAKRGSKTYKRPELGVPQGLAISNLLASIYMQEIDEHMPTTSVSYFRYVDDILMYGKQREVKRAFGVLRTKLKAEGLAVHSKKSGKTHIQMRAKRFEYLGYVFQFPAITVRESTIERFLQSIAAMFSSYSHNKVRKLKKFKYLTDARLKEIFLLELNERISGAISERRRYGWIAYFNQITDLTLLHRLDRIIRSLFSRLADFQNVAPPGLKRLARAYFEMKFDPEGGYVKNFDKIQTQTEKLKFLFERGLVGPDEPLTDFQIEQRFIASRDRILKNMHADEGVLYG